MRVRANAGGALNGCKRLTDESVYMIAKSYSFSLQRLELFGCFDVTAAAVNMVALKCKHMETFYLGQCCKLTNISVSVIARGLPNLQNFNIRGCRKVYDSSLSEIIKRCPIRSLVIANCSSVTDSTISALASPDGASLTCLDVSGVEKLTDRAMEALIRSHPRGFESLDLSSTQATERCVYAIVNSPSARTLVSLKLNFCRFITDGCVYAVVSRCTRLRLLLVYGCGVIRCLDKLMLANPKLDVRFDSSMKSLTSI